jgi:hypothetical protein
MKIVLLILAVIGVIAITILYGVCKFTLLIAGRILAVLAVIVAVLGVAMLVTGNMPGGVAFLIIAFAISPLGIPMIAAVFVGWLGGTSRALRDYISG